MRHSTIEIADHSGQTFKMEITTNRNIEEVAKMVTGGCETLDLPMTGFKDDDGRMGHIRISRTIPGYWRVVDKGHIRYNSGRAINRNPKDADLTVRDLILTNLDGTWGMQFWRYRDYYGVNSEGTGAVIQPWVIGMQPGKFSWIVID